MIFFINFSSHVKLIIEHIIDNHLEQWWTCSSSQILWDSVFIRRYFLFAFSKDTCLYIARCMCYQYSLSVSMHKDNRWEAQNIMGLVTGYFSHSNLTSDFPPTFFLACHSLRESSVERWLSYHQENYGNRKLCKDYYAIELRIFHLS